MTRIRMPRGEFATAGVIIAILAAGSVWAQFGPADLVGQGVLVLLAAIGAYGLNLITGYAGQASMGNAGFMAIGGMTAWYLGSTIGNFLVAVLAGVLAGFVCGGIVGAIALRWRGFYLVLATLAVQSIVVFGIEQLQLGENSQYLSGFPFAPPSMFGTVLLDDGTWFVVVAVVVAIVVLLIAGLVRGPLGRAWMAVRENEAAASVAGVDVVRVKVLAFAVGSGIISLGGALSGFHAGAISYESYPLTVAVSYVAMIIVGGLGSMAGPFLGACAITLIPYGVAALAATDAGNWIVALNGAGGLPYVQIIAYSIVVLLFLAFEPRGLAALGPRLARLVRRDTGDTPPEPADAAQPAAAGRPVEEPVR
ncbi:branched-chain amino acid ABC transporter permease [Saccharopolyspora phatthalungensis]|uniref:Branched-chain amino acid transport system permease protein n=1 Tax=Saccharopolyspora phatthalungensis TaxID=664693 RepID=A0A840QG44_9PSEU|nr:branched-chain amino acid ABC transporter permease [Saccharopolyspora phatthalungensis]MBB5158920.1 branched-chain amino acid transport system permease protein [Saccharopolyspora phatthalungensis]